MMDDCERINPVPVIDSTLCNGCGLCVIACRNDALANQGDRVVVADPGACDYAGLCETICPVIAVERPFLIVVQRINNS